MEPEPEPEAENADENDDDDDMLGFNLFESNAPRRTLHLDIGGGIELDIVCLDEEPIGVQSGQLLWPAAPALSRYLVSAWEGMPGETVVELGAGCGMAGITAARLGSRHVVMTDRDAGALDIITENIQLNTEQVDQECHKLGTHSLTWGEAHSEDHTALLCEHGLKDGFSLVLAADVVRQCLARLLSSLSLICSDPADIRHFGGRPPFLDSRPPLAAGCPWWAAERPACVPDVPEFWLRRHYRNEDQFM
jgi:predicted nicotinamide N-methyase